MYSGRITRVLGSLALIGVGMVVGWFSHELSFRETAIPLKIPQPIGVERNTVEIIVQAESSGAGVVSTSTTTSPVAPASAGKLADGKPNLGRLLELGRYETVLSICGDPGIREHCDREFLAHLGSGAISTLESDQLAELWLAEFPDHIDAAMVLVQRDIDNEHFRQAVGRLAVLESYQVENSHRDRVTREARKIAREALIRLTIKNDQAEIRGLLAMLIEIEPEQSEWRYSLAGVEKDLGNLESALTNLTFILYDPVYGGRASKLYDEILQDINLAEYVEIPLRKSGRQYLVNVNMNLNQEITMVLDTGATISAVDSEILRSIGVNVENGRPVLLNTAGGQIQARIVRLNSIGVGGQVLTGFDVASLDTAAMNGMGLLGIDYLDRFSFVIDDRKRRLYLRRK